MGLHQRWYFNVIYISSLLFLVIAIISPTATPIAAQNNWSVGNTVGLCAGTEIRVGSGLQYDVHTLVPEDNWTVMITGGSRFADGQTWWDTSRALAGDPSGGTGWISQNQAEAACSDGGQSVIAHEAVWDAAEGIAFQNCLYTSASPLECVVSLMQSTGASPQAIAFTELLQGEGYMVEFTELGVVDLAAIVYPGRANGNSQYVLVNGVPEIVFLETESWDIDITQDPNYPELVQQFPNIEVRGGYGQFLRMEQRPEGGQRIIFAYTLIDGCRACFVDGSAYLAFDFDSSGQFLGTRLLSLGEPQVADTSNCPNSPAQQMAVGEQGQVTFTDGSPTNLRSTPSTTSQLLLEMPQGYTFQVIGGAVCAEGYSWWNLQTLDGVVGWSAEGNSSMYFIEPLPRSEDGNVIIRSVDIGYGDSYAFEYNPSTFEILNGSAFVISEIERLNGMLEGKTLDQQALILIPHLAPTIPPIQGVTDAIKGRIEIAFCGLDTLCQAQIDYCIGTRQMDLSGVGNILYGYYANSLELSLHGQDIVANADQFVGSLIHEYHITLTDYPDDITQREAGHTLLQIGATVENLEQLGRSFVFDLECGNWMES